MPLGWGNESVLRFLCREVGRETDVSLQELTKRVVAEPLGNDGSAAKDDMTCGVVDYRHPRRLLVITGPPFAKERDGELADMVVHFEGRKVICGGTTAGIVARLLNRPVKMSLTKLDPEIPPASAIEGVDLITEGTMALARVAKMLERGPSGSWPDNPARDLMKLMLRSDVVHFLVGTRINEAHQDPNVPVELDLRRNIIRKITGQLEGRYLKETHLQCISEKIAGFRTIPSSECARPTHRPPVPRRFLKDRRDPELMPLPWLLFERGRPASSSVPH